VYKKLPISNEGVSGTNRSAGGDFFIFKPSKLVLSDGTIFQGFSPEWQTDNCDGEVVFNTGMTGYVESLTDPSYHGQILVFTFPLIGNYGVQLHSYESNKIQVKGVIVSEAAKNWSHTQSDGSLIEWLYSQNIPILTGVDTRELTKHLRVEGSMMGSIGTNKTQFENMKPDSKFISIKEPIVYNQGRPKKIILVDCGTKKNILHALLNLPAEIKQVLYNYDYSEEEFDGVLISNGPGNPADYEETIDIAKKAMDSNKPVFGICLGSQIMGLAAGAKTYKLKYGHRGHNQPCLSSATQQCYITSQNHGYAIDESSLPDDWAVLFRNLNDNSVEGIEHTKKPFFSVQFHPEACPGPTDTKWLFERFYQSL
jgi:carbamoyl-phosphate synthase small subunit